MLAVVMFGVLDTAAAVRRGVFGRRLPGVAPFAAPRSVSILTVARRPASDAATADRPPDVSVAAALIRLAAGTVLVTAGLVTAGLDTAGLDTAGLDTAGLDTAGFNAAGLVTAGLVTAGLVAADLVAASLIAADLVAPSLIAADLVAAGLDVADLVAAGLVAAGVTTARPAADAALVVVPLAAGVVLVGSDTVLGFAAAGSAAARPRPRGAARVARVVCAGTLTGVPESVFLPALAVRVVGAFLAAAIVVFLLANDCGLVSAWRLRSGLDKGSRRRC